ncbi:MAG: glycine--tRNA ligase [Patescibacteria group bacterium]
MSAKNMENVVNLAKRRGFVYPSSEIYGGLGSVYDYGPLGVQMLRNIRDLWWQHFIIEKEDVIGIESQIFMHPQTWVSSGHVGGFSDPLIECKKCHNRFRADHLINDLDKNIETDGMDKKEMKAVLDKLSAKCPVCKSLSWDEIKDFNTMFKTSLGATEDNSSVLYLRPETAQGMFVLFKNILSSTRLKVPFGVAQQGKAFRNEITTGKFIFRTLEFEQMELQYFIKESDWQNQFERWRKEIEVWYTEILGLDKKKFLWKPHKKLAHYAKAAEDYTYEFSWGFDEVSGLHYRTDFDLKTHQKNSGSDMAYLDPLTGEKFIPHDIESTWGLNRNLLMLLEDAYDESDGQDGRAVGEITLHLNPKVAPVKVGVFPLVKKERLPEIAQQIVSGLTKEGIASFYDESGSIGRRYRRQDEIGTPYCITVDFDSLEDKAITIRDRDTLKQERIKIDEIGEWLKNKI